MVEMKRKDGYQDSPMAMPEYPSGLVIHLNKEDLDKLGITKIPTVGDEFSITAEATVSSVMSNDLGDEDICVCLQICEMECSPEVETSKSTPRTALEGD